MLEQSTEEQEVEMTLEEPVGERREVARRFSASR
jgi:hypothetical protein